MTPSTSAATSGAEAGLDVGQGGGGVLHRVVQQGGGDGGAVEPEARRDAGAAQGCVMNGSPELRSWARWCVSA